MAINKEIIKAIKKINMWVLTQNKSLVITMKRNNMNKKIL